MNPDRISLLSGHSAVIWFVRGLNLQTLCGGGAKAAIDRVVHKTRQTKDRRTDTMMIGFLTPFSEIFATSCGIHKVHSYKHLPASCTEHDRGIITLITAISPIYAVLLTATYPSFMRNPEVGLGKVRQVRF